MSFAESYPGLELLAPPVVLLDSDLSIAYVNPAAENLFELSKKQLLGHTPSTLFTDADLLLEAIDKAVRNRWSYTEQELELSVLGKTRLHLSCTVSPIEGQPGLLLLELRHIDQQ